MSTSIPALVERYLEELARDGACGETGVCRMVYSPEWVAAQNRIAGWCSDAGLTVCRDTVGNVWGALEGSGPGGSIVTGSHIDSQCPGGRFDGALGVIAGVVALRTLRERFGEPRRTLEAVSLAEEESSRFPAANFWASRAITGQIDPQEPWNLTGYDGASMAAAMDAAGLDPARVTEAAREGIDAFIELHIEQGPCLEAAGVPAGIVTAITGFRTTVVDIRGQADHAGAMPMDRRRDALAAAAEIVTGLVNNARELDDLARTTVGRMTVEPNLPAAIPEHVTLTIDARHPDPDRRRVLHERHERCLRDVAARKGVKITWRVIEDQPPCPCNPELVAALEDAAAGAGIPTLRLISGAAHDAQVLAARGKVGMIFVRSRDGRSHTPEEFTSTEDAVAGIRILTAALHRLAY
jgi:allantoate deiminase